MLKGGERIDQRRRGGQKKKTDEAGCHPLVADAKRRAPIEPRERLRNQQKDVV